MICNNIDVIFQRNFQIENKKLEWNAQSRIGSLHNAKHKAGGGDKKVLINAVRGIHYCTKKCYFSPKNNTFACNNMDRNIGDILQGLDVSCKYVDCAILNLNTFLKVCYFRFFFHDG